jgi:hypothetical protein
MKEGLVPLVCLLVITPLCAYASWKFALWFLQKKITEHEEGQQAAQATRTQAQPG